LKRSWVQNARTQIASAASKGKGKIRFSDVFSPHLV